MRSSKGSRANYPDGGAAPSPGILLVDKPQGPTSHDIVAVIRRLSGFAKVGHAGTLDPMATGLLIILLGTYTKQSNHFSLYDKEYDATLCLGITTDTGDKDGTIMERKEEVLCGKKMRNIERLFARFRGDIEQVPPMYSAKKVGGRKLYELARKGVVLEREPKTVSIKEIEVLDVSFPSVRFRVRCSKGTYIRQLALDIGREAGCGAHITSLRRTHIGPFSVTDAVPFEKIRQDRQSIYENILQP